MWIFGYGSLLWKTNFPYEEKRNGYIKNYIRRFWQASLDHRGTTEKPGRVVTLIYTGNQEDLVWGTAFKVASQNIPKVIEYLDFREKNGYSKRQIQFYPTSPSIPGSDKWEENFVVVSEHDQGTPNSNSTKTFPGSAKFILGDDDQAPFLVEAYIAERENEHFLGPAPLAQISRQITLSHGISGSNLEYLLNLYRTLIDITPAGKAFDPDGHLRDLINGLDLAPNSKIMDLNNNNKANNNANNNNSSHYKGMNVVIRTITKCIKCDSVTCGGKCNKHLNYLIRDSCSKCLIESEAQVNKKVSSDTDDEDHERMLVNTNSTLGNAHTSLDSSLPTIRPTKS